MADLVTPHQHNYENWEKKNAWLRRSGMNIGQNVAIDRGFDSLVGQEEQIQIGDYSAIGLNCHIWNFGSVEIGRFCMLAADVTITNGGHETSNFDPWSGPFSLGHGCWVGTGAKLVGSISVGNNTIIGAGAVVVSDIPANSIAVGVPAKVIKDRELPDKVWHLGNEYFDPKTFSRVI